MSTKKVNSEKCAGNAGTGNNGSSISMNRAGKILPATFFMSIKRVKRVAKNRFLNLYLFRLSSPNFLAKLQEIPDK